MPQRIGEKEAVATPANRTNGPRLSGNTGELVRKISGRAQKTRHRLGGALVSLLHEKSFHTITVQDVLDRAGVGRATFYSHYRDKDDLFLSDIDEFLEWFAHALERSGDRSSRVAPVRELFEHVAEGIQLYRALKESGRMQDFLDLARGHFARAIEARLAAHAASAGDNGGASCDQPVTDGARDPRGRQKRGTGNGMSPSPRKLDVEAERRTARAQALAGALLSLLAWWLERDSPLSAQEMDDLFHVMVWSGSGGAVV